MSEIQGIVSGVFTIVLMVTFLAIWFWAWRPRHRPTFEAMAELPLDDLVEAGSEIPPTSARLARRDTAAAAAQPASAPGLRSDSRPQPAPSGSKQDA